MIIIPCHRVIGKSGDITGYAGGIKIKERLIELEKNNIREWQYRYDESFKYNWTMGNINKRK